MNNFSDLQQLESSLSSCAGCGLCETRTHVVFGMGDPHADILFIGEGPGQQEDLQGLPFVGPAGQLFDRMLAAIELDRSQIYIANIVKCRPPGNRNPRPDECDACIKWLRWQVKLIRPKLIVCMGNVAAQNIIDPESRISRIRGNFIERKGTWLFATYHPAALLRREELKIEAWQDFRMIRDKLNSLRNNRQ